MIAGVLLICMSGCATSGSQVTKSRADMDVEDRETTKNVALGMVVTTVAGLGAAYTASAYDHRDLVAVAAVGTVFIDLILYGIVLVLNPDWASPYDQIRP